MENNKSNLLNGSLPDERESVQKIEKLLRNSSFKFVKKDSNIQQTEYIHSEEIQEIVSKVPSWVLRWGIRIFLLVLIMMLAVSYLIKYPETISGNLEFITNNEAAKINSKSEAAVVKRLVIAGQIVDNHQPLLIVSTGAPAAKIDTIFSTRRGRVSFVFIPEPGATLKANTEILKITPIQQYWFGVMRFRSNVINRLKPGQSVLINIGNSMTGPQIHLNGSIKEVADEPDESGTFMVEISLDNKNVNRTLIRSWMVAKGKVFIDDQSLLERLYLSAFKSMSGK